MSVLFMAHPPHKIQNESKMAERSRSRSRSPEGGAPPADDPPQDENGDAPPPGDAPADDGEEVKLYIGNLDYGTYCTAFLRGK
jgi:hypothetical protein